MIGDELGLATAIENTKISKSTVEEIKQVLRLVMIKIGLRSQNFPSDEEKSVLMEHIIKNFGGHTCEEIKLAFDMAIDGKLSVEINCYENFSCLYFSSIMTAYRKWAVEAYKHLPKKENKLLEEKKDFSDDEMVEWINEWIMKVPNILNSQIIPLGFYDWLYEHSKLELTNEKKKEYWNKAIDFQKIEYAEAVAKNSQNHFAKTAYDEFVRKVKVNDLSQGDIRTLRIISKKLVLSDYLKEKYNEVCKTSE